MFGREYAETPTDQGRQWAEPGRPVYDCPVSEISIEPPADAAQAAAIVAAVDGLWPRPIGAPVPDRDPSLAWRYSGRWWQRTRMVRADRPWT